MQIRSFTTLRGSTASKAKRECQYVRFRMEKTRALLEIEMIGSDTNLSLLALALCEQAIEHWTSDLQRNDVGPKFDAGADCQCI